MMMNSKFSNAGTSPPVTSAVASPQFVAPFPPAVSELGAHFGVPPSLVPQSDGFALPPYDGSGWFVAPPGAVFDAGVMMTPQQHVVQLQQYQLQQQLAQQQQQLSLQLESQRRWALQQQLGHQLQLYHRGQCFRRSYRPLVQQRPRLPRCRFPCPCLRFPLTPSQPGR
ncbi:hypothetical protein CYMTET_30670 [Cymbomonas tetramitiformis]|uniref:Uncharacterized protein n=1 Tax=Cymbomonas tetramitiformis TaxID=36881 RepID=A0AAE0FJ05_9CHLO|nr:hypothetical protein CYMTET_30670 [Cymbomonas tetramitiformis]